ncbi:protein phosphatase 1 regulatory subunit 3B [Genypterus blacodes]|uniref:protein phosphatase 1 regulatory subunit 3B n=1 Tax=Genypterus blacodes TaxID=154954 RepID=UPI003F774F58
MPIELAFPLYHSTEEFGYRKNSKPCKPSSPHSCLRFEQLHCDDTMKLKDGRSPNNHTGKSKKKVTFADHKGLSLTRVKVFSEFNDQIDIPLNIEEILSSVLVLPPVEEDKLVLDFTQPSADYLHFRKCLESNYVCLEHCILKEKTLAGTVKVKNLSFEKSVNVRVTFDDWRGYKDVECQFVKETYPGSYNDTFSFEVSLPDQLMTHEHVEFAICYEVGGCVYWDSNQGKNYRIIWSLMKSRHGDACSQQKHSCDLGIHFDRYGSPTCSHGIFPDWRSYAGYENIGPYY